MKIEEELKRNLMKEALELRNAGLSYKQIGIELGISHATAHRWLNENAMRKHIESSRIHARQWYQNNKEKSNAKSKQYYHENKQEISKKQRRNYQKSRDQRLNYSKQYRENNKELIRKWNDCNKNKLREYCARRRADRLNATPPWLDENHKKDIEALHAKAIELTQSTGEKYEVDHIHPLRHKLLCGLHVPGI